MALPATDVFTGTNNTQLTTYSANWTLNNGDFDIQSNSLACDANVEAGAHWNADTFGNAQYAQCDIVGTLTSGPWVGVCVRAHASAASWYGYYGSGDDSYVYKVVSGTWTQLGSAGSAFVTADEIRLEVSGTTITPTRNGSGTGTPGAQTDSALSSGFAGVAGYADITDFRMDNWEGGDLGAAASVVPVVSSQYRRRRQ